ncbi:MAG: ABC transporter ATP-binding protein [Candidatus Poribacteria bacterium]|nr:ABC transporter ATP-binding protein [Candidatus Poribacteria bacterium]
MAQVSLKGISKRFGAFEALKPFDLDARDGEFLSFLGPSGCGKTTTLRIVAGLETPTTGEVYFDEEPVTKLPPADRHIAMVFQLNALYPYLDVRENIAFPLRAQRLGESVIRERVGNVAELLGISHLLDLHASEVHPAEGQRIAIAKAIVSEPRVFLLDEPFSHLDAHMRARMRAELKHLHESLRRTMLFVTHDQAEALALSDRIAVMRQGEIVQLGTPEEIFHAPTDQYVAEFVGTPPINLLPARFVETNGLRGLQIAGTTLSLARATSRSPLHGGGVGQRWGKADGVTFAVRPRYVGVEPLNGQPTDDALMGKVEVVEPMGRETLVHARLTDKLVARALIPYHQRHREGDAVRITFQEERVLLFDSETGHAL